MKKLLCLSLLCAVFMGVSARAQTRDTSTLSKDTIKYGSIRGIVVSKTNNEPLPGAVVTLLDTKYNANTDLDGRYFINKVPVGKYIISVRMMGFFPKTLHCTVKSNKEIFLRVRMKGKPEIGDGVIITKPKQPMIDRANTGSSRKINAEEINKIPGH